MMADTIKSLKKEFKEYKEEVETMFVNHKSAYATLKKAVEEHLWEPDAHNPAFLASKRAKPKDKDQK